ncbi:MAG: FUSC family membrane protein, partial [Pigmentiphaga sp.]
MKVGTARVRKFLYGHYFHTGLRQAAGSLLPPFLLIGFFQLPVVGIAAAFGALCVAILDQPGPQRHRLPAMFGSGLLGTLSALLTGVATSWPVALLCAVMLQTFVFGLFSAFGRRGGMVGFACLLLMTLTMHTAVSPEVAAWHALATLGGAVWYLAFSTVVNRL